MGEMMCVDVMCGGYDVCGYEVWGYGVCGYDVWGR